MLTQPQPNSTEVILYRTRTDILTDRRIIVDGTTYPLGTVVSIKVMPTRFYVPFQGMRLLALVGAIFFGLSLAGPVGSDTVPGSTAVRLIAAAALFGFAVMSPWVVPTHKLRLRLSEQKVDMMYSSEVDHLRTIAGKINEAASRLKY